MIHNQYKLNRNDAFSITLRAHRGGGFTKDRLYLSGLKKIYRRYKSNKSMDLLLTGKVAINNMDQIKYLQNLGLAQPISFNNLAFSENRSNNATLDFILNNLK